MNIKVIHKDPATSRESFTELLGQFANQSAAVVHDEIELVKQGVREKTRVVLSGALTLATGAAIGFAALLSLCAALIIGLTAYMAPLVAALVTAGALAFIGVVIAFIGFKQLKQSILKT